LEESNKTLRQTPSLDSVSDFERVWKEMDEIEPLTPPPSKTELDLSYEAYREAAKSDSYMFGEYNGYEAYGDVPD
jgi:hypothetical protein